MWAHFEGGTSVRLGRLASALDASGLVRRRSGGVVTAAAETRSSAAGRKTPKDFISNTDVIGIICSCSGSADRQGRYSYCTRQLAE